jgi:hypothetical protein
MGDRANVYVLNEGDLEAPEMGVWLYTHSTGHRLPLVLQRALRRREDWRDEGCLARIIFDEMLRGRERGTFCISATFGDNEHPILVVDCDNQRVGWAPDDVDAGPDFKPRTRHSWSFEEFCRLDLDEGNDPWAALKRGWE